MTTTVDNPPTEAPAPSRFKYFLRAFVYFVLLAVINLLAFRGIDSILFPVAPSWLATLVESLAYLVGVVALTWVFCRFVDRTSLRSLGLHRQGWATGLTAGSGLGALLQLLVFLVFAIASWLTVERSAWQPLEFAASVAASIVISFNEELAFRGYIMQRLSLAWGMAAAVVASSTVFALVHALNPNVQPLAIVSILVAGLFLACGYLVSRSLWLPIGLHLGWNLAEMHLLGFAGSGIPAPSIIRSVAHGPQLMTGGAFGPEGGIVGLAAPLIGIVILLVGYRIALANKKQQQIGDKST
jgi:membrane protease YdiL (CAAX protease family)